jgi:hypothetical protein
MAAKIRAPSQPFQCVVGDVPADRRKTLLIDLAFTNPFAPYDLKYKDDDFEEGLKRAAKYLDLSGSVVDDIKKARKDALSAHHHVAWGQIALWGLSSVVVLGVGGWLAAPIIGTAIGSAAGLSGAAATAHGLAILGGGSLALGGAGMAGGMWLVTGVGAAVGLAGGGGGAALLQLGAAQAKVELVKLQVNYKVVLLDTQMQTRKAQEVVKSLTRQRDEVKRLLDEERELNDKNSARVKDMEETLSALEDSLKWMQKEAR